jgi:hypothetical protein
MKHLKSIALIALLPLLTFCTDQRSRKSHDRDFTSSELIGKWVRDYSYRSLNETDIKIDFIQLVNDSIAELQINDSIGMRKVSGKWRNNFKKEIGKTGIKIESDICITYFIDEHNPNILLFSLSERNKKLYMILGGYKFQKK